MKLPSHIVITLYNKSRLTLMSVVQVNLIDNAGLCFDVHE